MRRFVMDNFQSSGAWRLPGKRKRERVSARTADRAESLENQDDRSAGEQQPAQKDLELGGFVQDQDG